MMEVLGNHQPSGGHHVSVEFSLSRIAIPGAARTVDARTQTEQIMQNVQAALEAAGARLEHVIKWNVYIMQGQPLQPGFEVFQRVWGRRPNPPAITGMLVAALAHPDFLVEIDVVAVVPQQSNEEQVG
jgi:enamine deaminase RidA (YjgF/YER057c/UK114 family)